MSLMMHPSVKEALIDRILGHVHVVDWPATLHGMAIVIVVGAAVYLFNRRDASYRDPNPQPKGRARFSLQSNYVNVSPMKHDLFKQATVEIVRYGMMIWLMSKAHEWPEMLLKLMYGLVGFFIYYQVVEPYLNLFMTF
jgi:hypothetical protein